MSLISPGLVLSALLATAYGAAFHLFRGGGYGRLASYLLAAWGGFALGQLVGWLAGWAFAMVGQVHIVEGTLGSLVLMIIAHWLAMAPPRPPRGRPAR